MMMIDYAAVLSKYYPGAKWSLDGGSYSGLTWLSDTPKPSQEELDAHWSVLQASVNANAYKEKRAREYPPLGDQLDALFHAGVFPPEMAAMIQAVKDKYPKGGN